MTSADSAVKHEMEALDAIIADIQAEDRLSKISALSDAPENARSHENKGNEVSSTGARAVGPSTPSYTPPLRPIHPSLTPDLLASIPPALSHLCHWPAGIVITSLEGYFRDHPEKRPAEAVASSSSTTATSPDLPASLARHHRQHDAQKAAQLAQEREAVIAKYGDAETVTGPWARLLEEQKHIVFGTTAERLGGIAVTVNLGDRMHRTITGHKDALGYVRKRMQRVLAVRGMCDLPFLVSLGITSFGRVHLHALIAPGSHDIDIIKAALFEVAGKTSGMKARLVKRKDIYYGPGAVAYACKAWKRNDHREERERLEAAFPGQAHVYMNDHARRLAREFYELDRPAPKRRRSRKTVTAEHILADSLPVPANEDRQQIIAEELTVS